MEAQNLEQVMDFDTIEKGQFIPAEEVERIVCTSRNDRRFGLRLMWLQGLIESNCALRGYKVTTCQSKSGIKVLTDEEASAYNYESFKRRMHGMSQDHFRLQAVDRSELTDDGLGMHDNRVRVSSMVLTATKDAYKEAVKSLPYKRSTPTLSGS